LKAEIVKRKRSLAQSWPALSPIAD